MEYVNKIIEGMSVTWRNKDMQQPLSQKDVDYFSNLAAQTPTKQSNKYFDLYAITNQTLIEKIFNHTNVPEPSEGFDVPQPANSQVVSPLLLVWVSCQLKVGNLSQRYSIYANETELLSDTHQAVGISAGVVAYEANVKEFVTGFCKCIDNAGIINEINSFGFDIHPDEQILLLLGIGKPKFQDPRQHQFYDMTYEPHDRVNPDIYYIK